MLVCEGGADSSGFGGSGGIARHIRPVDAEIEALDMPEMMDNAPLSQLLLLVIVTALVRLAVLKPADPPTAAGAAVMAVGIFGLGAFKQMPFPIPNGAQLITLELLIIWVYIASAFVASYFRGTFGRHVEDPVGCFAIGTWVAGTAVLGRMIATALPEWRDLALFLGAVMLLIWSAYLALIVKRFWQILIGPAALRHRVTGRILLSTVGTQSVLLLGLSLFPGQVPWWLAVGIIGLGFIFYALGFVLVVRRYLQQRGWRLADDWDNTNCILHGAISITGLAAVQSNVISGPVLVIMWVWVLAVFIVVEAIELARAWARLQAYGWRRGILTYDVSQWARNFTFGMFYTFTLQLYASGYQPAEPLRVRALQEAIVTWGHYVVLMLLLIETALFLALNVNLKLQRDSAKGMPVS